MLLLHPNSIIFISPHQGVPEGKETEVAEDLGVVEVVSVCGRETEDGPGTQREVVSAVGVHGLPQPEEEVDEGDRLVRAEEDGADEGGDGVGEDALDGVREVGGEGDGDLDAVVHLVDVLVEELVVEQAVGPVEDGVVDEEADGDLPQEGERVGDVVAGGAHARPAQEVVVVPEEHGADEGVGGEGLDEDLHEQGPLGPLVGLDLVGGEQVKAVDERADAGISPP